MFPSRSRLSESPLWNVQKRIYAQLGIASWAKDRVPFHITNNARIAFQYAEIVAVSFQNRPITILELGGGSGKFAFLLISELLQRKICQFRYFLTDGVKANVDFWNQHPFLTSWINQGLLQTVVYDPIQEDLPPCTPDFIIANYFFDSIPQDLFSIESGRLSEGFISVDFEDGVSFDDPSLLSRMQSSYTFRPLQDIYPDFPEAAQIVYEYAASLRDGFFLFPIGALLTMRRLLAASSQDVLLIAASRGTSAASSVHLDLSLMSFHGGPFSLPVNFYVLQRFVEKLGGEALVQNQHAPQFSPFLCSRKTIHHEVKRQFFCQFFHCLDAHAATFAEMVQRLQEAHWDATLFFFFFHRIQALFPDASNEDKQEMLCGMKRIRGLFFPLFQEESCLLQQLGLFFEVLKEEGESIDCFKICEAMSSLPCQPFPVGIFPFGRVLQIAADETIAGALQFVPAQNVHCISFNGSMDGLGAFDTIFFFPLREHLMPQGNPSSFFSKIEDQLPCLKNMVYSDADLDTFFQMASQTSGVYAEEIANFLIILENGKKITRQQLEDHFAKFSMPIDRLQQKKSCLFETMSLCLENHMKPGSIFHALLPGVSSCDEPRIFNEIMVNPYVHYEERVEPEGLWISMRKLGL